MSVYDTLNPMQREAVLCTEGPLLILAGAGSGKTRVLTHRIAYLIDEKGVAPWNILAITFTNKAAGEMRERVDHLVDCGGSSVWVSTFHSACVRILRRFIGQLGYDTNFTIYDADDQKTLMKQVLKKLNLDPKQYREKAMLADISNAKNELISVSDFLEQAEGDWRLRQVGAVYQAYQEELRKNNALDFDDLIFRTVDLFRTSREVLEYYQERFRYIHVDEYQDTNTAQFELVALLAGKYKNLCVVGDDDQSIYKFRGANIGNILNFENTFPGAKVIKLEQNYRSTGRILDAANAVIRNNRGRKEKTLWTANEEGRPVVFRQFEQAYEEAEGILTDILKEGRPYKDYAVLYRTNAQSRLLEEQCISFNVPYRLVGGVNFYQRREIKDMLCYLKTIANGRDDLAVQRIINVPKRGIGAASLGKVIAWAAGQDLSLYEGCARAASVPGLGKGAARILAFVKQIEDFRRRLDGGECGLKELMEAILEETGYRKELEEEGEVEAEARLENIDELMNKAVSYYKEQEAPTLDGFLEEVALVADIDRMDDSEDRVTLMTLHSAKGLEFPVVYMSGMEDGLFPGSGAILSDDQTDLEEERRLCYVGITRARERLTMTAARRRMVHGETRYSSVSRFVEEIPEELLEEERLDRWTAKKEDPETDAGQELPWYQVQKKLGVSRFGMKSNSYASPTANYREAGFGGRGAAGGPWGKNEGLDLGSDPVWGTDEKAGSGGGFGSSFGKGPGFGKTFTVHKSSSLDYAAGDRVRHIKFGEGTVLGIKDGVKDFEVTVDFDRAGVKKMFASFAKLQKL